MAQGKEQGRLGFRSPGSLKEAEQIDCFCLPNQVCYNVYKGIKQITGPSPSNLLRLATSGPPPSILHAGHNISPRLRKQLVLELEVWKMALELIEGLPCRIFIRQATPLDQHAPGTPTKLRPQGPLRRWKDAPIEDRRHGVRCGRRVTSVALQQPHMEDVVDAGALRKL